MTRNNDWKAVVEAAKGRRWVYLALFCLINFCTGALYVWSVFAGHLAAHFSDVTGTTITGADLGPVFGVATGLTPFLMLFGGFFNDRMGPRLLIAAGGVSIALGYAATTFITDPTMLYLTYGVCVGAGTGLVNGCTINSAVKFFPDRRGFAGGTVTACLGVGAAVLPLAANALIGASDIMTTFWVFGAVSGVVIVSAALLTGKCPEGFSRAFASTEAKARAVPESRDWLGMIRTPEFLPLFLLFTTSATMGLMLLSNISLIAREQLGATAAVGALAVSVISLANTAGRFISGTVSDRIGRMPTLVSALLMAIAGFGLLMTAAEGELTHFFIGIVGIGICFGAFIGTYPGLVADEYGPKHNSVNFSIMMLGYSVGGLVGPQLVRWAQAGGSFDRAYGMCAAAAVFGILCAGIFLLMKARASRQLSTNLR